MSHKKQIGALFAISLTVLFFQNCDQAEVNFASIEDTKLASEPNQIGNENDSSGFVDGGPGEVEIIDNGTDGGSPGPGDDPGDVDINYEYVSNACDQLPNYTAEVNIDFPQYQGCLYNQNGNLNPVNRFYQARVEHSRLIQLPPGAVLCDIDFNTEVTQMQYDDHFMLTLNNYLLGASNEEFIQPDYLPVDMMSETYGSLYKYDWADVVGKPWDSSDGTYCLGEDVMGDDGNPISSCTIPVTDTPGMFSLNIGEEPIQNIMAATGVGNVHEFKLIVTGDDNIDCRSSAFSFNTSVKYVVPQYTP